MCTAGRTLATERSAVVFRWLPEMTPGRDHVGRRLRVAPSVCAMASVWAVEIVAAIALRPKATVCSTLSARYVLERLLRAPTI